MQIGKNKKKDLVLNTSKTIKKTLYLVSFLKSHCFIRFTNRDSRNNLLRKRLIWKKERKNTTNILQVQQIHRYITVSSVCSYKNIYVYISILYFCYRITIRLFFELYKCDDDIHDDPYRHTAIQSQKSISSVELHLLKQQRTLVKPKMDIENRAYKHFHRFAQIAWPSFSFKEKKNESTMKRIQ